MANDVLAKICADKRRYVAARKQAVPESELRVRAQEAEPPRGFRKALAAARAAGHFALIAEIKRASPSAGLIRADFDVVRLARAYAEGGAACLSVLTDAPYFQGADEFVAEARQAAPLPVLRKDFMLDPYQIVESRAIGADAVLLILAALTDAEAVALESEAIRFGMDVLVEVHDDAELDRALKLKSTLIGVNNRDLKSLKVDLATGERLIPRIPAGRFAVAESGLAAPADLARMAAAGAGGFLVGESLMRAKDVAAATRALLAPPAAKRAAKGSPHGA
ncbi:MAG: indole-3-glycerol phosphate synthase TrpC [Alphaproteobacteria bacterium]|nr:indole-3-glycerol phosphate synthase TrpC [Alphaproteobacteria bacterium]